MHFPRVLDSILFVFLTLEFAANISAHAVYNRREQPEVSPLSKTSRVSISTMFASLNSTHILSKFSSAYSNSTSLRNSTATISLASIPSTSLSTVTPVSHVIPSLSTGATGGWSSTMLPSTNDRSGFSTRLQPKSTFSSEHQAEATSVEGGARSVSDEPTMLSTSHSRSLVLSPKITVTTQKSSLSMSLTTPQKLLYTQVDASNHTSVFNIPITTTITSPPAGLSIINASNSQWTGDTTTTLNGSAVPVLLTGDHKGLLLKGLGVGAAATPGPPTTDPADTASTRPGCDFSGLLVLLKLVIPCGAAFVIPGLIGTVVFNPKGFPIWVPPTEEPPAYIDDAPPAYIDNEPPSYSERWPVYDPPESSPKNDHDDEDDENDDEISSSSNQGTKVEDRKTSMSNSRENSVTVSLTHFATRSSASASTDGTAFSTRSSASASTAGTVSSTFSATRSSASSTFRGTAADWFIQVRPTADTAEVRSIQNAIVSAAGGAENVAEISFNGSPGSTAFVAFLTNASADILRNTQPIEVDLDVQLTEEDDNVGESKPTSTSATSAPKATSPINSRVQRASGTSNNPRRVIQKRVALITQYPAPPHLKFISQSLAIHDLNYFQDYVWQAPGGEGVDLFVVDTGANPMNHDYLNMHHEPIWLWPSQRDVSFWGEHSGDPDYYELSDSSGLGSCTLSLAAGYQFGSSKRTQTYIVKIPSKAKISANRVHSSLSSWVASASIVYNQIQRARAERQTRPTVVLFPRSLNHWGNDVSNAFQRKIKDCLQLLFEMNAVVIMSIGSPRVKEDGSLELQWPAAAHKWFSQIIRVGSVSYDGQQYESPRAAHGNYLGARLNTIVDVSAPGDSVECASGQGNGYQTVFGNVYSAAIVAGFAAALLSTFLAELTLIMGQLQQTLAQALLAFMTRDVVTVAVDGTLDFRPGSFSRNGGPRAISNGLTGSCMIPNPVMAWKRNAESIPEAEPMACRLQPSTASSAPTALITVSSAPTTLSSGIPLDGQARARTAAVIAGIQGEQSAAAALASVSSSSMAAASFAHAGIAAVLAGIQGAESAKAAIATISSSSMVAASLSHVGSGASGSATVAVTEQIASTSSTAAAATKHQTTRPTIATSTASVVLSPSPPPTWAVFLVYQIYTWTSIPPSTDYYNKIYLKNLSIDTAEPNFCASNSWIWNTQLEGEVEDVPPYPAGVLDFALPPGTVEKEEDGCTWKADSGPGDLKCSSFLKSVTCTNTETPALICPGVNPNRIVPLAKCVW